MSTFIISQRTDVEELIEYASMMILHLHRCYTYEWNTSVMSDILNELEAYERFFSLMVAINDIWDICPPVLPLSFSLRLS